MTQHRIIQILLTFEDPIVEIKYPCPTWIVNCNTMQTFTWNNSVRDNINLLTDICLIQDCDRFIVSWSNESTIVDEDSRILWTSREPTGILLYVNALGDRKGSFHLMNYPTGPITTDSTQNLYLILFNLLFKQAPTSEEQIVVNVVDMQHLFNDFVERKIHGN